MSRLRPVALAASLLVLSSCAGSMAQQNVAIFHDAQRRYTRLVRFSDWEKAGRFVAPDARQVFRSETAALGDLRFSDYEIQDVQAFGDTATALVAYTGWRASSPTVVTYLEDQQWELAEDGTWVVRPKLERQQ
jgi:hypothetical protein